PTPHPVPSLPLLPLHPLSSPLPDPAPTDTYTLSLHDALPISLTALSATSSSSRCIPLNDCNCPEARSSSAPRTAFGIHAISLTRSEEHTSELQSRENLVCRLLLEKKKKKKEKHNDKL